MLNLSELIAAILALVGGVVWAIRLEGKVANHDNLFIEREKQSTERQTAATERLDDLKTDLQDRLARIEIKLDSLAYGRPLHNTQA
jgi:hypothetical protein